MFNLPSLHSKVSVSEYIPTEECPKPSGVFPNRSNCSTFFLCNDGIHHLQECPGGLHYDRKRVRCNFPKLAKCKDGKTKVKHKPKPSETLKPKRKQSRHCPRMDGIFSNPANCSTFFFCVDGTAYLQECPWGLSFDEANLKCDRPKVVGCAPPSGTLSVLQCPDDDGLFRHPVNCHTFYRCRKGRIYEYDCPVGLVFNYDEKRCDYKSNVQCPEHHLERRKHQRQYMKVQKINLSEYLT
ncbi:protein obstructor-E-like [Argiope bruennichi]|uniref:protein obstructor-E-like n=1 Tax=Argiope bruennichi TaxID=94029 RepID=UPI00249500CA|nr:protein obstructor-E-like [Argiope bruennichi]